MGITVAAASVAIGAAAASAGGGGIGVPDPPKVSDVACVNTCAGLHKATEGSKVEATGRHLGNVKTVVFDGPDGGQISVDPVSVSSRSVKAKVPNRAVTGHPKVVDAYDNQAGSPTELEIVPPDQIPTDAGFKLKDASASPSNTFFDGSKPARVEYVFGGGAPTDIRIAVVNRDRGEVVDSWVQEAQTPYEVHSARWQGTRKAPNGRYRFRIGPVSGSLESTAAAEFEYHREKFPVRGPHSYGDGFGAPRSGHVHMGQDVMAACGTPLQAARGGTVQWKAYQASGGGYYVVIDGKGTDHDFVYMHLAQRARVHEGDRVHTGQRIGIVGDTGDATGCHLHFEIWNGDWWNGGEAMASVTRQLRRWDSWS